MYPQKNKSFLQLFIKVVNPLKIMSKPVVESFGLIVYFIDENGKKYFLLHQPRDSYGYRDLILGNYSPNALNAMFKNMTLEELNRVSNYSFDELWKDFWLSDKSMKSLGKIDSEKKYKMIRNVIKTFIDSHANNKALEKVSYGFPKGRQNVGEFPIQTAIREFEEETLSSRELLSIKIEKKFKFEESFTGTDKMQYKNRYFVAQSSEMFELKHKKRNDSFVIREDYISFETGSIFWLPEDEIEKFKYLSPLRKNILSKVLTLLND